jgi:hypothetical protein
MIKAFPKIFALGNKFIRDIFNDEVEITEKIDGSQISFFKSDDVLYMRSKNAMINMDAPDSMFTAGVEYVYSIRDKIPNNVAFYGEYLKAPKHNCITYGRIPKNHIALFGAMDEDSTMVEYDWLCMYADLFEVEVVPCIYQGKANPDMIKDLLERESVLGNSKIEGVVVKNYQQTLLIGGQVLPLMCGKYVSDTFKEVNLKNWKDKGSSNQWQMYMEGFNTEARLRKAIQYIEETGELERAPQDIGKLMKRIHTDIVEEQEEDIKQFLWNLHYKELLRVATKGIPERYKEMLLEGTV